MKLNTKILAVYLVVGSVLLITIGYYADFRLKKQKFDTIHKNYMIQLYQVDFAITGFLQEVEYDVRDLLMNEVVRTRDDSDFTQFLDANEEAFEYTIGETEQAIIDVFNSYRTTHPYVNSVYMGRENGSFVRSHERTSPTQYDPRERPWYQLAKNNPGGIMRTSPYPSVTTTDINLGIVGALVDEDGDIYGVVGIDVTLNNLTEYISNIDVGENAHIILLDENGILLAGREETELYQGYDDVGLDYFQQIMDTPTGYITFEEDGEHNYLFYYTSAELGWKICVVASKQTIDQEVGQFVSEFLGLLLLTLFLLVALTSIGMQYYVVHPIKELRRSTEAIIQTHDLSHRITIRANDEIGQLGRSINTMVRAIREAEEELQQQHQHLEQLVEARTAELAALYTINRDLAETLDMEVILPTIAQRVMHVLKADRCTVFIFNEKIEMLQAQAAHGYMAERLSDFSYRPGEEIVGQAYQQGTIQYTPDIYQVPALARRDEIRSVLAVPLISPTAKPLGVLSVASLRADAFTAEQQKLIATLSGQIARAIENARLYHAAQEADRIKSAFLASMSHELRTPLNSIIGFTGILLQGLVGPLNDEQNKQLSMVRNSARHLLALINDVLDISKIEAGQLEVELESVDMRASIEKAVQTLLPMAEKKGLSLKAEIAPEVNQISGDRRRVEQVLLNLINNGVKFTETGGVRVTCEVHADCVVTRVIDTGMGIKPEDSDTLFKPFRQIDTGLSRQHEGTGLGLSICRKLVDMMGGTITVESEWGIGSTFMFTLPIKEG